MEGKRVIRGELIYVIPDLIAERKKRVFPQPETRPILFTRGREGKRCGASGGATAWIKVGHVLHAACFRRRADV